MLTAPVNTTKLKQGDLVRYNGELTTVERGQRKSFGIDVVYLLGINIPIPVNEVELINDYSNGATTNT